MTKKAKEENKQDGGQPSGSKRDRAIRRAVSSASSASDGPEKKKPPGRFIIQGPNETARPVPSQTLASHATQGRVTFAASTKLSRQGPAQPPPPTSGSSQQTVIPAENLLSSQGAMAKDNPFSRPPPRLKARLHHSVREKYQWRPTPEARADFPPMRTDDDLLGLKGTCYTSARKADVLPLDQPVSSTKAMTRTLCPSINQGSDTEGDDPQEEKTPEASEKMQSALDFAVRQLPLLLHDLDGLTISCPSTPMIASARDNAREVVRQAQIATNPADPSLTASIPAFARAWPLSLPSLEVDNEDQVEVIVITCTNRRVARHEVEVVEDEAALGVVLREDKEWTCPAWWKWDSLPHSDLEIAAVASAFKVTIDYQGPAGVTMASTVAYFAAAWRRAGDEEARDAVEHAWETLRQNLDRLQPLCSPSPLIRMSGNVFMISIKIFCPNEDGTVTQRSLTHGIIEEYGTKEDGIED